MMIKIILISLSLIVVVFGSSLAETNAKPSTSHIDRPPAEKRLNGILRSTDKDQNPSEPFHIARSPAEKALDAILLSVEKDDEIISYILGTPWHDANKDADYSLLFTKEFLRAVAKKESDLAKKVCRDIYVDGVCNNEFNPITCAQSERESGYLHRTVENDSHKAIILSRGVDFLPTEIKSSYRLIKKEDRWMLDGVNCGSGGQFNMDCSNSVCARDLPHFLKKAEKGSTDAQYILGVMYHLGWGVQRDYGKASSWFHKAAKKGHVGAQSYLGYIYKHGQGVKEAEAESAKWYRKAAEQGKADAQYHLGLIYEKGRGVQQDYFEAMMWLRKAAELGHADAQYHLGLIYEEGHGVSQDHAEAVKWYRKAAELGHRDANKKLEELDRR